jgi:hypothetical protein
MQLFVRLDLQIHNIYKLLQGFDLGTKPKKSTGRKILRCGYEIYHSAIRVWLWH